MNAKELLEECRDRKAFMLQCLEERDSWKAAAKIIDTLPSSTESLLLMYRYVSCYKWDDIAAKLELNRSYCYKLHTKALKMLDI